MNAESQMSKEDARFALTTVMLSRAYEKISDLLAVLEGRGQKKDQIVCGPAGLAGGEQKIVCRPAGLADRNSQIVCGPAGLAGGEQKIVCGPAGLADRNSQIVCGPAGLTDKRAQTSEHRETREVREAAAFGRLNSTLQSEPSGGRPTEDAGPQKQAAKTVEEYEMSVRLAELVDIVIRVRPAASAS